jgi:SAM-dependent methyltransferase
MRSFYLKVLSALLKGGVIGRAEKVLVVCGGELDRDVLLTLGFTDVTISNVDPRMAQDEQPFKPYTWGRQDAENLACDDDSFDLVLVHAGLHHCRSPHRALLEMYRAARRAIVVIEARDSLAMRWACRLGFAAEYEVTAVATNGWEYGGVDNSPIPNYVYRWTEREVAKTLATFDPRGKIETRFFYGLEVPYAAVAHQSRARAALLRGLSPLLYAFSRLFPGQGNCFAFYARKPVYPPDLHPWLKVEDGRVVPDRSWR